MDPYQAEPCIFKLSPKLEQRIKRIPYLNIDSYIIPSPYIGSTNLEKDYEHSYVWIEEREILGLFLVYSNKRNKKYLIYKQITSPFTRSRGIGTSFIEKLKKETAKDAEIYLYIWKKQFNSIEFFQSRGFEKKNELVYKKLTFYHLGARADQIDTTIHKKDNAPSRLDEIGKTRHDARKQLRLLSDMVDMLTIDNSSKIIEDINRETTALINMLNACGNIVEKEHTINLKDLITERIIPYIEVSPDECKIVFTIKSKISEVIAGYEEAGRALINLISNALESIQKTPRKGVIKITLEEINDEVFLTLEDNGQGIMQNRLKKNEQGIPEFVGISTHKKKQGKGFGTRQIYSCFGKENIKIESEEKKFCRWQIRFHKSSPQKSKKFSELLTRYETMINLNKDNYTPGKELNDISSYIWQTTNIELFMYELIFQFSTYNNIRDIYRSILAYQQGETTEKELYKYISGCRINHPEIRLWILEIINILIKRNKPIEKLYENMTYRGVLMKSFGQSINNTMIFTMCPRTGHFKITDRKLAEHLDFVRYLNGTRDEMVRGEFKGDLNKKENRIFLGVWQIENKNDMIKKISLLREAATKLIEIGIKKNKEINFYHTTYNSSDYEINTYKTTTLQKFSELSEHEYQDFITETDEELKGLFFAD